MEENQHQMLGRSVSAVTLATFASKLFGFGREIAIAAVFGLSVVSDGYNVAYRIVFLLFLLGNTYVDTTFIPAYAKARKAEGEEGASAFASNILTFMFLFGLALALVLSVFPMPPIRAIAPMLDQERFDQTVHMLRVMLPMLPIMSACAVLSSVLNARSSFIAPQLTALPMSVAIIAACAIPSTRNATGLAASTLVGVALQLVLLWPFAKGKLAYRPRLDFSDPRLRNTLALAIPALIGGATMEINPIVDTILGSGMPQGAIAALGFSSKLLAFTTGVLLIPLVTVMFSQISGIAANGENISGVMAVLRRYMETVIFIALPITLLAIALSSDVVRLAFEYGRFGSTDTELTARIFAMFLPGVTGIGLTYLLTRTFYALKNTRTPAVCGAFCVLVHCAASVALSPSMGAAGLALGTSLGNLAGAALLLFSLHKKVGLHGLSGVLRQALLCAVCAVAACAVCLALKYLAASWPALIRLVLAAGGGLGVYAALALALRVTAVRSIADLLAKLVRRG